ncbi:hypothetical protein TYRP_009016 [Tyrophagus putrescentiae]|nr:hypothetical protein TYRP_009016 [Tyrophagus putrescentiae]
MSLSFKKLHHKDGDVAQQREEGNCGVEGDQEDVPVLGEKGAHHQKINPLIKNNQRSNAATALQQPKRLIDLLQAEAVGDHGVHLSAEIVFTFAAVHFHQLPKANFRINTAQEAAHHTSAGQQQLHRIAELSAGGRGANQRQAAAYSRPPGKRSSRYFSTELPSASSPSELTYSVAPNTVEGVQADGPEAEDDGRGAGLDVGLLPGGVEAGGDGAAEDGRVFSFYLDHLRPLKEDVLAEDAQTHEAFQWNIMLQRPLWQTGHFRQREMQVVRTWSPTFNWSSSLSFFTPTDSTIPAPSCPRTAGVEWPGHSVIFASPQTKWASPAQTPAETIFTRTSPGPGGSMTTDSTTIG